MSCYSLTRIMLSLSIIQASLILLSLNRIIRNVQRSLPLRIVFSIRTSNWLSGSSCDKIYRMLCREHSHCCGWFLSPHLCTLPYRSCQNLLHTWHIFAYVSGEHDLLHIRWLLLYNTYSYSVYCLLSYLYFGTTNSKMLKTNITHAQGLCGIKQTARIPSTISML